MIVALKDAVARLRLHFASVAFEKGLMLSFRGGQHVAHADAVLDGEVQARVANIGIWGAGVPPG